MKYASSQSASLLADGAQPRRPGRLPRSDRESRLRRLRRRDPPLQVSDKPVARVNGAVLTDRDLLREMYAIFPYAQQHNGFPKAQEAAIRQGALEMIIFEELVYQEAERRKLAIPAERLNARRDRIPQAIQQSRRVPAIPAGRKCRARSKNYGSRSSARC